MSKNVSVKEGDRARNFGPTAKIKTELQEGGYCYWVPEDERETGMVFASENREYTPDEIGKYGIDEIDINIIFTGIDPDGNPWDVYIDPDTGLPVIEYPTDDIEIDPDTGLPIIEIDPDTGLPVIDDGTRIIIDPITSDTVIVDIDSLEPIVTIDDDMLGDMTIDPLSDIELALDDLDNLSITGLDIDGIDVGIDLDLDTLEWEKETCPESIYILSRPASLVYTDGDTLDFTGLAIAALDKDGMEWPDTSRPTPISGYKIITPTGTASIDGATPVPSGRIYHDPTTGATLNFASISDEQVGYFNDENMRPEEGLYGSKIVFAKDWRPGTSALVTKIEENTYLFVAAEPFYLEEYSLNKYGERFGGIWGMGATGGTSAGTIYGFLAYTGALPVPWSYLNGMDAATAADLIINTEPAREEYIQTIPVQWVDPCLKTHETDFDITVYPKTSSGGSHHSGNF